MAERLPAAKASVFDEAEASSLDPRAQTLRWSAVAAVLAVGSYLLARYVGIGPPQGPWAYWPIQGLLCGILFRRPVREWAYIVVAAIAAQLLAIYIIRGNLAGGATAVGAAAGAAQAMLGAWVLRRHSPGVSPLESPRALAWFVAVGVCLVPLLISPLSAAAYSMGLGIPFRAAWGPLFVGNSLSMLIFATPSPATAALRSRRGSSTQPAQGRQVTARALCDCACRIPAAAWMRPRRRACSSPSSRRRTRRTAPASGSIPRSCSRSRPVDRFSSTASQALARRSQWICPSGQNGGPEHTGFHLRRSDQRSRRRHPNEEHGCSTCAGGLARPVLTDRPRGNSCSYPRHVQSDHGISPGPR